MRVSVSLFPSHLSLSLSDRHRRRFIIGRVSVPGAVDAGERGGLRERDEPRPADVWVREDVRRGGARLVPQAHDGAVPHPGGPPPPRPLRRQDGRGRGPRSPPPRRHPPPPRHRRHRRRNGLVAAAAAAAD